MKTLRLELYTNKDTHTYCVTEADWGTGLAVAGLGSSPCFFPFPLSLSLPFPLSLMESPSNGTLSASLQKTNVAVTN